MPDTSKAYEKFVSAKTIDEIKELNILFVKGEISGTCYHLGNLDPESKLILSQIIQINELGLITTWSQPGMYPDSKRNNYCQRAVLSFIIKKEDYEAFKIQVAKINDSYVNRISTDDKSSCLENGKKLYWVSKNDSINYTHIGLSNISCYSFHDCDLYEDIVKEYFEVEIIDPVWGRNTLFDDIIKAIDVRNP